ncbi:MAG: sigma factor [Planctomycetota bacterium]
MSIADLISLDALSTRQRRRVEGNLALVHITIDRIPPTHSRSQSPRDRRDLFQEGTLALVEAVRNHDPARHGDFAMYAMARVHQALGRYLHEDETLIRVPYIEQRRRKDADRVRVMQNRSPSSTHREGEDRSNSDRLRPDRIPRITPYGDLSTGKYRSRSRTAGHDQPLNQGPTLCDALRRRLERSRRRAIHILLHEAALVPLEQRIILHCETHRWAIPDPVQQTPLRTIAAALGSSVSRVVRCEQRFRESRAAELACDRLFIRLLTLSRQRKDAWNHLLDADDYTYLRHGIAASTDILP